jgi:hypothetical protein
VSFGQISQAPLSRNKEHLSCRLYPSFFALVLHKNHVMMQQVTSARRLVAASASPATVDVNKTRIAAGHFTGGPLPIEKESNDSPPEIKRRPATSTGRPIPRPGRNKDRSSTAIDDNTQTPGYALSRPTIVKPL